MLLILSSPLSRCQPRAKPRPAFLCPALMPVFSTALPELCRWLVLLVPSSELSGPLRLDTRHGRPHTMPQYPLQVLRARHQALRTLRHHCWRPRAHLLALDFTGSQRYIRRCTQHSSRPLARRRWAKRSAAVFRFLTATREASHDASQ